MKKMIFYCLPLVFVISTRFAQAQITTPQPSPFCKITQKVGLAELSIAYSRPGIKGRTIFGDLVPFDKIWRTGANAPTKIKFDDEVSLEGNKVVAGEYTLLTIPGKTEWTLILNKDSKGGGASTYQEADDVVRFKVKANTLPSSVESFSIFISDIGNTSAMIEISWEKTSVKFKLEQDVDTKVMAQIQKQLDPNKDANLYFQIAGYYYETNRNLPDALTYITKSTDMNPRFWTVHLKAKIQHKLNDKKSAIATAEKSIVMAKEAKNDDYVRLNEKLIAECKK